MNALPLVPRSLALRAGALALLAVAALPACEARASKATLPAEGAAAARAVRVGKPAKRLETGLARATGSVRSRAEAVLAAKTSGQIKAIRVEVGDRVKAGQTVAEMDAAMPKIGVDNARAAVRLAEANLASAELELERGKALAAAQTLPVAQLDRLKTGRDLAAAQLDQARAGLRMAEQQLRDTTLVAPFAGVITAKLKNAGDSVTGMPVTPLVALTDVDHLEIRAAVPEGLAAFVEPGALVSGVTTPGEQRFQVKVLVKSAVVDPMGRTVEVLADLATVEGPPLRPGVLVNLDFGSFGDRDGVYVSSSALVGRDDDRAVFVLAGGKAERRRVEGALVNPGVFAVAKGVGVDADVILDPGALAPGDAVVPLLEPGAAPAPSGAPAAGASR
jgi:RND family efflux transporter MFP subunit